MTAKQYTAVVRFDGAAFLVPGWDHYGARWLINRTGGCSFMMGYWGHKPGEAGPRFHSAADLADVERAAGTSDDSIWYLGAPAIDAPAAMLGPRDPDLAPVAAAIKAHAAAAAAAIKDGGWDPLLEEIAATAAADRVVSLGRDVAAVYRGTPLAAAIDKALVGVPL